MPDTPTPERPRSRHELPLKLVASAIGVLFVGFVLAVGSGLYIQDHPLVTDVITAVMLLSFPLATGLLAAAGVVWLKRGWDDQPLHVCFTCHYNLKGLSDETTACPECGERRATLKHPPPRIVNNGIQILGGLVLLLAACFLLCQGMVWWGG
jgi:DNA-directed RNA polymerase subunit RPC12/RpoP